MKITHMLDTIKRYEVLRNKALKGDNTWSEDEIHEICDLLWDYRIMLLNSDVTEIGYHITF